MSGRSAAAPAISVVIPAHNEARFLGQAIASICAQTFQDFEILVVNNGSTDATGSVIAEWVLRDSRVRPLNIARRSLSQSLCEGVVNSRGDFVARIDADDFAF